ncbi:MAG: valine--tRNA ligase [Flavobacteriales bacterium]|nr:valine--tRNA ligase [Flavobacteriales bacterium]
MDTRYSPKNIESKWYNYWTENNLFDSEPNDKKPYTILIPPPNVTGILHMGHMLNNTLQDVLIRRSRLLGFNACWVPGTDHASIATEAKVIKKLKNEGIEKKDLCREEFLKHAWDWTDKHGGIILQQLKRLGASCDWSRVKFTMDPDMSESVIDAFITLYKKGYIYRGKKMINWDPEAQTAVSDEEVIHKEQESKLYYVNYNLVDSEAVITIATTRPETILGDTAICVHPTDKRYLSLIGTKAIVPLINREIPIISDEYIDSEFGTGALKVTPAHDINDYLIGEKNDLEIISVIDKNGCMHKNACFYVGEDRFLVREKIIKDIESLGQLDKIEYINNKVGFSERTDAVIEPRLSSQWFMKMDQLASPALNNVINNNINFYPKKFKNVYKHWMENIRDWCLSRQLWWGHRIPAFYYNESNYVVAKSIEDALIIAREESGNVNLSLSDLKQDEDVLDTWFSSWLWPMSVFDGIRNPNNSDFTYYYPTNDLVTGHDILFFWVARMIIAGYEFNHMPPFKNVYFTGMVRDKKRRKMSKSLGNSPDPIELINKYGADGVRSGMLFSSPAGNDLLFDETLCEQGRNFSNKIWNAFRLINSWESRQNKQNIMSKETIVWFENKLSEDIEKINKFFLEFRISDALMVIYKLFWNEFCGYYLEIIKPSDKVIDVATKEKTLYFFEKLLILLHPFMPFITEDIWQKIISRNKGDSISFCQWPNPLVEKVDFQKIENFNHLFKVIASIRNIRKEKNISFKEKLSLFVDNKEVLFLKDILQKTCNLDEVRLSEGHNEDCFPFLVDKSRYFIPLTFDIDSSVEIERIENEIIYLQGFLEAVNQKLSNEKFTSNAPKKIIMMEEKKRQDTIIKLESLKKQLNSFNGSNNIQSK